MDPEQRLKNALLEKVVGLCGACGLCALLLATVDSELESALTHAQEESKSLVKNVTLPQESTPSGQHGALVRNRADPE